MSSIEWIQRHFPRASFEHICLYGRARVYLMSGEPIIDFLIEQLTGRSWADRAGRLAPSNRS